MNRIINRLVNDATARSVNERAPFQKGRALFLALFLGLSCVCVSSIFLTFALFVFLQPLEGNAEARCVLPVFTSCRRSLRFFRYARNDRPASASCSFVNSREGNHAIGKRRLRAKG